MVAEGLRVWAGRKIKVSDVGATANISPILDILDILLQPSVNIDKPLLERKRWFRSSKYDSRQALSTNPRLRFGQGGTISHYQTQM